MTQISQAFNPSYGKSDQLLDRLQTLLSDFESFVFDLSGIVVNETNNNITLCFYNCWNFLFHVKMTNHGRMHLLVFEVSLTVPFMLRWSWSVCWFFGGGIKWSLVFWMRLWSNLEHKPFSFNGVWKFIRQSHNVISFLFRIVSGVRIYNNSDSSFSHHVSRFLLVSFLAWPYLLGCMSSVSLYSVAYFSVCLVFNIPYGIPIMLVLKSTASIDIPSIKVDDTKSHHFNICRQLFN